MRFVIRSTVAPLWMAALAATLAFISTTAEGQTIHRVLFIGNSLTAANDLPEIVRSLAQSAGHRFEYRMVAFPDHSLEDHWNRPEARRAISEGQWTTVVLQQGQGVDLDACRGRPSLPADLPRIGEKHQAADRTLSLRWLR